MKKKKESGFPILLSSAAIYGGLVGFNVLEQHRKRTAEIYDFPTKVKFKKIQPPTREQGLKWSKNKKMFNRLGKFARNLQPERPTATKIKSIVGPASSVFGQRWSPEYAGMSDFDFSKTLYKEMRADKKGKSLSLAASGGLYAFNKTSKGIKRLMKHPKTVKGVLLGGAVSTMIYGLHKMSKKQDKYIFRRVRGRIIKIKVKR